ncbi:MAG: DUF3769 domain-containing protein [Synechococcales cyanobacterium RM1_1_8]|nr:DUF3769 domain-containing protein [Synechococcales cyanobacterium RM1_1_8]
MPPEVSEGAAASAPPPEPEQSGQSLAQTEVITPEIAPETVPDLLPETSAEDLAPLLSPEPESVPELPVFSAPNSPPGTSSFPSITEPLLDFETLPTREQEIIPVLPNGTVIELPGDAPGSPPPGPEETPGPEMPDTDAPISDRAPDLTGIIQLDADRQTFDQQRNVISAEGEVLMRFQSGVLSADRVQINLFSRVVVADGNAAFVRGQQRLRGERIEYNITQDQGRILQASGEIYTPTSGTDLLLNAPGTVPGPGTTPSDRITQAQPLSNISNPGQITITTGFGTNFGPREAIDNTDATFTPTDAIQLPISISTFRQTGQVNRWRFESEDLALVPGGFDATDVRLTNDPFSPPQFELRSQKIEVRSVSPLVDEILMTRPRYVFEDKVSIPTFRRRILLDRRPRDDGLVTFGFDGEDRGGLYFERGFEPISSEKFRLNLTPQYYLQRSLFGDSSGIFDPSNFGIKAALEAQLTPGTTLRAGASTTTARPSELRENTRASINLGQALPLGHVLDLNYGYRNRVYNGSLGFRTVRENYGVVVRSPNIPLGTSGIVVNYQGGLQRILADTDRIDLLEPIRDNNRIALTRWQVGATALRNFSLWQGQALPATAEAGLRYSPVPITPYANLSLGLTGLYSGYSNGESQPSLTTTLSLNGQVGHFAKNWLDFTSWNVTYSQAIRGDASPFQFDRIEDTRVLGFGLRQQVYGPIRFGLQSSLNLDTGERFSTDYTLEYSRRAYGVELRYNPVLELGSVTLRISDFNWLGGTDPFREVKTGVAQ